MITEKIKDKIRNINSQAEYDAMRYNFEVSDAPVIIKDKAIKLMEELHPVYSGTINHKINNILDDIHSSRADDIKVD